MSTKNNSKSIASFDVLSGLAFELNAPLKSISKSTKKIVDEYKTRDFEYISYKDFKGIISNLEQVNRQLERCCQTTERMIRLKKDKTGLLKETCGVNDIIQEILGLLDQQLTSAKIKVIVHLGVNLPLIRISQVDCHQIILNVLMNAIQAMPAGGKLKIKTVLNKNMVDVHIEDEGIGITPEHLTKVFEPFFTTKERGFEKSSGLGLSIVYSIVHAIGGDIHIQSSLRKGTVVNIQFPHQA